MLRGHCYQYNTIITIYMYLYIVKPILRGHLWGQKKCGLLRQVTS